MGVLAVGVGKVQEALPFFKTALEANSSTAQFWLSYIDALIKLDRMADAKALLDQAKGKGAKGEAFDKLAQQLAGSGNNSIETGSATKVQDPPQDQTQPLINLYNQGQLQQALDQVWQLLQQFPNSVTLYNISGAANKGLGKLGAAIDSFKQAIKIKPDNAEAYYNMGVVFQEQGKLEEAIEAYNKALAINPDYTEACRYAVTRGTFPLSSQYWEEGDVYEQRSSARYSASYGYFDTPKRSGHVAKDLSIFRGRSIQLLSLASGLRRTR